MSLILHQIKSSELNFLENVSGEYTPPAQIVLLPKSPIVGRDGRTFTYNTQEVLASFIENQADLPIDIEHATEIKAPKGEYSGAVGFIKSIQSGAEGEILANIEWNNAFELSSKAYKYYSPAFEVDDNNKVLRLTSVGLTNRPNFKVPALNRMNSNSRSVNSVMKTVGLQNSKLKNSINSRKGDEKLKKLTRVLNAKQSRNEEEISEEQLIEEVKDILDLSADTSLDEVLEEIAKTVDEVEELKEESGTSNNSEGGIPESILSALGLSEGASVADVVAKIKSLKKDDSTETNNSEIVAMQSQITKLTNIINDNAAKALKERKERVLNSAEESGKISPATREAIEISLNSVEAVDAFEKKMENAPSVFTKRITKPAGFSASGSSLNAEQKEWCKKNGIKEKDYISLQNKEFNRE